MLASFKLGHCSVDGSVVTVLSWLLVVAVSVRVLGGRPLAGLAR